MNEPSYFATIPAPVRYHPDITANAKLLYGELTCLCKKEGYAWATNKYFSDLYRVKPEAVSRWVSELRSAGFITIEVFPERGNERRITLAFGPPPIAEKRKGSCEKTQEGSCDFPQLHIENNTRGNNTGKKDASLEVDEIEKAWNESLSEPFPKIKTMGGTRGKHARARLRDDFWRGNWRAALERMAGSNFLAGRVPGRNGQKAFVADIDFFLKPDSVAKILEGKYDNAPQVPFWEKH